MQVINLFYGIPMASNGHGGVADHNGFIWSDGGEWGGTIDYSPIFKIAPQAAIKAAVDYFRFESGYIPAEDSRNNLLWLYMLGRNML